MALFLVLTNVSLLGSCCDAFQQHAFPSGGKGHVFKELNTRRNQSLVALNASGDNDETSGSRRQRRRERRRKQRREMDDSLSVEKDVAAYISPPSTSPSSQFDMAQRFESIKTAILGALSGGVAVTPFVFLHSVVGGAGGLAQWEFTTDMSSLEAALFAIVYRYAVRANDNNPMLNQGVVGAFVFVRTLSNIQVSPSCSAIPLQCERPNFVVELV